MAEMPAEERVMYRAKDSATMLYSQPGDGDQTTERALKLAEEGYEVIALITEEHFLHRTSQHFVRWLFAGEQKESEVVSYEEANHLADSLLEDQYNTDIEVLPARLKPGRMREAASILPDEELGEQHEEPETESEEEFAAETEQTMRAVGVTEDSWSLYQRRDRALEQALALHGHNTKAMAMPLKTEELVASAQVILEFLHPQEKK